MNSNISVEMFRKIMDGEQFQTLNFAIEEHLSLIYAVYGGEQSVKENYPAVYDVIQSTRKKHLEGKELNHQTLLQLPEKERNIPTDYVYGAFWQQNSEKRLWQWWREILQETVK